MENDKNRNYGQSDRDSQNMESQSLAKSKDEANEPMNNAGRFGNDSERSAHNSHNDSTESRDNRYDAEGRNTANENSWSNENGEEGRNASSAGFESGTNPDRYQNLGKHMDTQNKSETRGAADRSNENNSGDEMRTPGL